MIRFRFRELVAEKSFRDGKPIAIGEVAEATGINRRSLSRIANERGYTTGTDTLEKLCRYFGCRLEELAEYIPDDVEGPKKSAVTKRSKK